MPSNNQERIRRFAEELAPLVTSIGQANGIEIDAKAVQDAILSQSGHVFPVIAQNKSDPFGAYYYIIYGTRDREDMGLGELDIALKIGGPKVP